MQFISLIPGCWLVQCSPEVHESIRFLTCCERSSAKPTVAFNGHQRITPLQTTAPFQTSQYHHTHYNDLQLQPRRKLQHVYLVGYTAVTCIHVLCEPNVFTTTPCVYASPLWIVMNKIVVLTRDGFVHLINCNNVGSWIFLWRE